MNEVHAAEALSREEIVAAVREVGRGSHSARALSRASACRVFGAMLDGTVPDLALGALLLAWRIKGESTEELAGFLDAVAARMVPVPKPRARPLVVIPTYNGARHLPNLVPLLAGLLARAGCAVLMHGLATQSGRVTTAEVLAQMGLVASPDVDAASRALDAGGLAFVSTASLSPGLAQLLALREAMGVRNSAHTVAKMLSIDSAALRLVSVTHPEYIAAMQAFYAAHPFPVLLMRGCEGEAVAHARRAQRIDWLHEGRIETVVEAAEGTLAMTPALPPAIDAVTTARWIEAALAGDAPVPPAIAAQAVAIGRIVGCEVNP
jgi:anthranilate phosphoribosyltransferase